MIDRSDSIFERQQLDTYLFNQFIYALDYLMRLRYYLLSKVHVLF